MTAPCQRWFAQGWLAVSQIKVFIALKALALGIVWFMGRSQVTGAPVNLKLFRERLQWSAVTAVLLGRRKPRSLTKSRLTPLLLVYSFYAKASFM